jgi:tetratricopeptide (TPR) repeat protein
LKHFLEANKTFKYYQLYYNIGLCYLHLDNLESAVYYFDTVTKENKNNIFAFYNLIKIFLKQKNFNDAYLLYHEFIEITKKENQEPGSNFDVGRLSGTPIHYIKIFYKIGAYCCFAKSLYQECIHTILEGLKFNPDDPGTILITI